MFTIVGMSLFYKAKIETIKPLIVFILGWYSYMAASGLLHVFGISISGPKTAVAGDGVYYGLILSSVAVVVLYNLLDVSWPVLVAWGIELFLIIPLNLVCIADFMGYISAKALVYHHGITTLALNAAAFGLLTWNWWHGCKRLYSAGEVPAILRNFTKTYLHLR